MIFFFKSDMKFDAKQKRSFDQNEEFPIEGDLYPIIVSDSTFSKFWTLCSNILVQNGFIKKLTGNFFVKI